MRWQASARSPQKFPPLSLNLKKGPVCLFITMTYISVVLKGCE